MILSVVGAILVGIVIIMVDWCIDAFIPKGNLLVPSQVSRSRRKEACEDNKNIHHRHHRPAAANNNNNNCQAARTNAHSLVPSQLYDGRIKLVSSPSSLHAAAAASGTNGDDDVSVDSSSSTLQETKLSTRSKRRNRRPRKKAPPRRKKNSSSFPSTGNLPDAFWRAVPMEHLRLHPLFEELPPTSTIRSLDCLEDARNFRQGSYQWEVLHYGRCTTSQAVAALGFLEPTAAQVLAIPPAWRKGGMGAFHRLRQAGALRTLEDMRNALLAGRSANGEGSIDDSTASDYRYETRVNSSMWVEASSSTTALNDDNSVNNTKCSAFTHQYIHDTTDEEMKERRKYMRKLGQGENMDMQVRLLWGNTQEATALLTALNYFNRQCKDGSTSPPCIKIKEAGMCGAGLNLNTTSAQSSLLVGATPDGILEYADGSLEALEVKNHCPFFSNRNRKRHGGSVKRFSIGNRPIMDGKTSAVFPQYVAQLQMEMLCLGPKCRSAVMVRQTANHGALVIRMKRDDAWIEEMLYWLHRFQKDYVEAGIPPERDFFWNSRKNEDDQTEQARYRRFVNRTAELKNTAKVVAEINNTAIQRVEPDQSMFLA